MDYGCDWFMIWRKLRKGFYLFCSKIFYNLGNLGVHSCLIKPMKIDNPRGIKLGNEVCVHDYAWLMGCNDKEDPGLVIDDFTIIGHFSHIVAYKSVHIENSVLIADKVFISDCSHNYLDVNISVLEQGIHFIGPVTIGEGTWLGENVCICGASVGKHSVIGANSVVTNNIPDYSVACGCPAKVIKRYDQNKNIWIKV